MTATAEKKRSGIPLSLQKELISLADLCDRLDCSRYQIRGLVDNKEIKTGPKIGKTKTFTRASVDAYEKRLHGKLKH